MAPATPHERCRVSQDLSMLQRSTSNHNSPQTMQDVYAERSWLFFLIWVQSLTTEIDEELNTLVQDYNLPRCRITPIARCFESGEQLGMSDCDADYTTGARKVSEDAKVKPLNVKKIRERRAQNEAGAYTPNMEMQTDIRKDSGIEMEFEASPSARPCSNPSPIVIRKKRPSPADVDTHVACDDSPKDKTTNFYNPTPGGLYRCESEIKVREKPYEDEEEESGGYGWASVEPCPQVWRKSY